MRNKILVLWGLFVFLGAIFYSCLNLTTGAIVSGSIPGSYHVTDKGAGIYHIPIQTPPGTNQMQPNIAAEYNSQNSNGLLGKGWNVTGFSAITRHPRTIAQDGVKGGGKLQR